MSARRSLALALVGAAVLTLAPRDPTAGATTARLGQRYAITATLDVGAGRLDAVLELSLTNESAFAIDHVNLGVVARALGFLTLTEAVTVEGDEADAEWTTGINLRVPVALAPGGQASLRVPFRLDVGRPPDAFTARLSRENGVLSFGQWFPIVGPEHDIYGLGDPQISYTADAIRLDLTTTSDLPRDAVACPGLEAAPVTTGRAWTCVSTEVRDFSFVVNPRFRLTTRTVDDHEIRVYTETVSGGSTADLAADGLTGLEETFGDYPWPDLVLAEVGSGGGFSMEYPRMIHLTRDKVADPYVVYHEVAHQWFYGQLGNHQQREPWLDEAFADFSARYLMGIGENACSTRPVDSSVFAWEAGATSGGDWTSCDGYFHAVFYQGTEFIAAVRSAMGDGPFFDAMRDWVEGHRHGLVRGRALLRHWMRASDADLQPIFERYLEGTAVQLPFRLDRRSGPPLGAAPE
ncbi:MAG TPA: M1 family aminopeptidase [Candidatus Limnocylindria bacterium]